MKRNYFLPIIALIFLCFFLSACGKQEDPAAALYGVWQRDDQKDTLVFDSDGNFSSSEMWGSGTYTVKENTLSVQTARSKNFTFAITEKDGTKTLELKTDLNTFIYIKDT